MGIAQILVTAECSSEKKKEFSDILRASSGMITELLKNMLESSKMDAGMIEIENIDFDLADLVQETALIIATKVAEKDLSLYVHLGETLPTRWIGDPLRLRQIMVNLLSNAIKFTEKGHIALFVNATIDEHGNEQLCITVSDTGIGISEEARKKIFGKYAQANSSIGQTYGGTGLGLSISQDLAYLMNGDITVKSWLGLGSQFIVTLPLQRVESRTHNI